MIYRDHVTTILRDRVSWRDLVTHARSHGLKTREVTLTGQQMTLDWVMSNNCAPKKHEAVATQPGFSASLPRDQERVLQNLHEFVQLLVPFVAFGVAWRSRSAACCER